MRDLYKLIGLSSITTRSNIEKVIPYIKNDEDREAVRQILLNDKRRRVYDRSYQALEQIGHLRANLDLQESPFWLASNFKDFNVKPRPGKSLIDQFSNRENKSTSSADSSSYSSPSPDASMPQSAGPPRAGKAFWGDLPGEIQRELKRRQKGKISDQIRIKTEGFTGTVFGTLLLCAAFVPLFYMAESEPWESTGKLIAAVYTLGLAWFSGKSFLWIYRWFTSTLKCNLYVTPVYLIETHLDEVRWWPLWTLKNIQVRHNLQNGIYQNSSLQLHFKDEERNFVLSPKRKVEAWLNALNAYDKKIREAVQNRREGYVFERAFMREAKSTSLQHTAPSFGWVIQVIALLVGVLILLSAYDINSRQQSYTGVPNQPAPAYASPAPVFSAPEQPLPEHGAGRTYFTSEAIAPLEIRTRGTSSHYLVKLVNWYTDQVAAIVFIRAGQSVSFDVPLGSYRIKYATGSTWYGETYLFGEETSYSEVDRRLDFIDSGYQVSGYTLELYLQANGNLRTNRIKPGDF